MPQLDFNTFAGVAWWITIIFYFSYIWFLIYPFARIIASEKAAGKYRLWRMIQIVEAVEAVQEKHLVHKNDSTDRVT